jgi:tRNA modification GTPase
MSAAADTIAAPATPAGTAALAIVRVSGPAVATLASSIFGPPELPVRTAMHRVYQGRDHRPIDEVVATRFQSPNSFTGEDLLEISTHGNPLIVQLVMEDLLARGCRSAGPGEFTRRAFLNGRIDLSQAEAVMDVIHARSERALAAAQQQLRGSLGRHLQALMDQVVDLLARVEAYIDFPEEDLPPEDTRVIADHTENVLRGTKRLLATAHYGELLREGMKTVIIGEPNVGKSSLLNALLGRERALVSPEPGTTRDYLEDVITVGAHTVRLIDTAGLNPAPGVVERMGIAKTLERAEEADLFLVVLDSTRPTPQIPSSLRERLTADNTILVINKSDLVAPDVSSGPVGFPYPALRTSAVTGEGIESLAAAIAGVADRLQPTWGDEVIAINARHADALQRAADCLQDAVQQLASNAPVELLSSNLRGALDALGEIAGKVDHEQVLDRLFATFCIGK